MNEAELILRNSNRRNGSLPLIVLLQNTVLDVCGTILSFVLFSIKLKSESFFLIVD